MQGDRGQSVTEVTISSRLLRLFHRDRSRKQHVVFKMNVLVQIHFEFRHGFVKRLVADTRVGKSSNPPLRLKISSTGINVTAPARSGFP
jgi:hypothetical protein